MNPQNSYAMKQALLNRETDAVDALVRSELGKNLFTMCDKACLDDMHLAAELFRETCQSALKDLSLLDKSTDVWIFSHFHKVWPNFYNNQPTLLPSSVPLKFEWNTVDLRQGEDALRMLNADEREMFIYRFLLKYPMSWIQNVMQSDESRVVTLFHASMSKVIPT